MGESTEEFLFGALSRAEGRADQVRRTALGFYDLSQSRPVDPLPGAPIEIRFRCGADLNVVRVIVYWTADGSPPDFDPDGAPTGTTRTVDARPLEAEWDTLAWGYFRDWLAIIPPADEGVLLQYSAVGLCASGRRLPCPSTTTEETETSGTPVRERPGSPQCYAVGVDRFVPPDWFRHSVIYQVFIDRFAPEPGQMFAPDDDLSQRLGGSLCGLIDRLDDLAELGVDALWLTPVFASPDYHGYATSDFNRVEPALGGDRAWDALVAAARKRGMRLILDFVANHVSDAHPAFISATADPGDPHRAWFRFRDWPSEYECFFDVRSQPELDTELPAAREFLIDAALFWLERGADGFRLDYARGMTHAFWSHFRAATRRAAPESICFGEVTLPPPSVRSYTGRFDGCLDFTLCELLRGTFARGDCSLDAFDAQVQRHLEYFDQALVLPSFLDNHDMNRFLWQARNDRRRLKVAVLAQFLLPGPPVIYYGTEVGLSQRRGQGLLEEARLPMPERSDWDQDLVDFYRSVIALRRDLGPWKYRWKRLDTTPSSDLAIWQVGPAILAINCGTEAEVTVGDGSLRIRTNPHVELRGTKLRLPAWSGAILAS